MRAYDPLSYHNGSVWPHDTAICAAGAARYGRWDVVDRIVDGALRRRDPTSAAVRPSSSPASLAATPRRPVAYPASCSPQAWSSASILLLVRTMLGLEPDPRRAAGVRPEPGPGARPPDQRHRVRRGDHTVEVREGTISVIAE